MLFDLLEAVDTAKDFVCDKIEIFECALRETTHDMPEVRMLWYLLRLRMLIF